MNIWTIHNIKYIYECYTKGHQRFAIFHIKLWSTKVQTLRPLALNLKIELNLDTSKNIKCVIRSVIMNYHNDTLTKC